MMKPMTRRQFYSRMRSIGYKKSPMQLSRMGVSYVHPETRTMVTIPKDHEQTFMVTLSGDWRSGTWTSSEKGWGNFVNPRQLQQLECSNLLEFAFKLMKGEIQLEG